MERLLATKHEVRDAIVDLLAGTVEFPEPQKMVRMYPKCQLQSVTVSINSQYETPFQQK
jgi:hypothetical protein